MGTKRSLNAIFERSKGVNSYVHVFGSVSSHDLLEMEDPTMSLSSYPWGRRHEANSGFSESDLPRDNSLAEIAPWTTPSPPEVSAKLQGLCSSVPS